MEIGRVMHLVGNVSVPIQIKILRESENITNILIQLKKLFRL